ncbi:5-amino-6-(D-ribitylamino)uracil--L-tyrosine 4-hydroxyphenyl transferase CofH [Novosphingobium sp. 9U]|uniref:5-amino-6-(D-ribitylamino)uracil--L-tyrosine 4-hydroxyphenyl transferase CofH n=1 Tax=Novosphingobium sp. 9U TaxID=2653158 RepID=UPI0012F2F5E1|nr:5-amino-6-(D-ribitylamino)uracil--L-tyrosine 4-hydroxyphenyl transferase CofH [Novosphingobium sp. 9U]VWX52264.1 7,8-didemethyl-8-hydroxy-5-deazariboflavin synthase / 5-amino-6-(D-ribitylamino)uracil--L-tyrosine 4-hydroxyphenyl transferase [Novosphingobium sp. 9U]
MAPADRALTDRLLFAPLAELQAEARARRDASRPARMTYSRKVFIPLTRLCADVCHYCTFATTPSRVKAPYLTPEQVLEIAREGAAAGCKEALFTLGDAPERRYAVAREWLAEHGFERTIDYVRHCAGLVLKETGLLPHINAGVLDEEDWRMLRPVMASGGLMLESTSERLLEKGACHHGSPDKVPAVRLASLAAAGRALVPVTSGILIGIGETAAERIEALLALRDLQAEHGHLQEVIVQNFCPKPGTKMAEAPEATEADFLRVIAAARIVLPDEVSVQAPPNLNDERLSELIDCGIDDWGGISPVTQDHVNPEAPWPEVDRLAAICARAGLPLVERLTVYPRFVATDDRSWIDPTLRPAVLKLSDSDGLGRDSRWSPGVAESAPGTPRQPLGAHHEGPVASQLHRILDRAAAGEGLAEDQIVALFATRGAAAQAVVETADALRAQVSGEAVTYVINRNINYTNICTHACSFCAFSKTSSKGGFRDKPYDLDLSEIAGRAREAVERGATEVCLQGGIHPRYTGETYLSILRAVKAECPDLHVHAFSPLEVSQGARTLSMTVPDYLRMLKDAGLGSLPGTAAEILCDDIRAQICPDKVTTQEWLDVVGAAHEVGLPTTSTIMFGHLERPEHWARHLLELRRQQDRTGGFTEFVPLPLVHMEAPFYRRGQSRKGPTWREAVMMHAVARLALHGSISSIQCSWVKLGVEGAAAVLAAGANDLGGVLMNESISRAAGASHGQDVSVDDLHAAAAAAGRPLKRRTTLYGDPERRAVPQLA